MKKISLFLGSILLLASCTSTQWAIIGDVTAYNSDGTVLRQWDNVVIESGYSDDWNGKQTTSYAMKTFGINFSDPVTQKNIIISNAVPCIIEYNNSTYSYKNVEKAPHEVWSTTMELFNSNEMHKLDRKKQQAYEKLFITEINNDIKNASIKQDLFIIKKKIDILDNYSNSLPSKNYEIVDALYNIKYAYKRKAKKLGINL